MASCDPNFANVALLLHCDGTNGSTSFPDSSPNANVMTAYGSAQIATASPEFGSGAALLGTTVSSANGISCPISLNGPLDLNQSSWTIEGWVLYNNAGALFSGTLMADQALGSNFWSLIGNGAGGLAFNYHTSGGTFSAASPTIGSPAVNTWYSWAVVNNNGTLKVYINGVGGSPVTYTGTPNATSGQLVINGLPSYINGAACQQDEIRITNGVARYTANYTPAGPFPSITCTPTVPNVVGQTTAAGTASLVAAGFQTTVQQANSSVVAGDIIVSHNPSAGGTAPLGSNVILTVSAGPSLIAQMGGDTWGSTGGGTVVDATRDPIIKALSYAQQPINAVNQGNQSVGANQSNVSMVPAAQSSAATPLTMQTPAYLVPTTPNVGPFGAGQE